MRTSLLARGSVVAIIVVAAGCGGSTRTDDREASTTTTTPVPGIAPVVPDVAPHDLDHDRIDDDLARDVAQHPTERDQRIIVETVFDRPITRAQLDAFKARGGTIDHVFRAASYGWVGKIARREVAQLPGALGAGLLLVAPDREYRHFLDEATLVGRVRPVWAPAFAGSATGFTGTPDITIAIMDTGIDTSHVDLAGRLRYWHDFSSEASPTPRDPEGHGSHVSGIAFGTGASFGVGPGPLHYTDSGDLTGFPAGTQFRSAIHLLPSPVTVDSFAVWSGPGLTALDFLSGDDGATTYTSLTSATSGFSGVAHSYSGTPPGARHFTTSLKASAGVGAYAITSTVTSYPAVGDGFPAFRGVAPSASYAGARVFASTGGASGTTIGIAIDDLIVNRTTYDIKIVNMSFGLGAGFADAVLRAKVNTLAVNGIIPVVAAGNAGPNGFVTDPGRAASAITVGSVNDVVGLTDYTSGGFTTFSEAGEDRKPDILAPGGSRYHSMILSVDSNTSDGAPTFPDAVPDDYTNIMGTSMATPFVSGAAALVIDALQKSGTAWDFGSSDHPLFVKSLLLATATETNRARENGTKSPTLGRATEPKDFYEGFGVMNPDAAVEALSVAYAGDGFTGTTDGGPAARRAWGRKIAVVSGTSVRLALTSATADFDLYLYARTPGPNGVPVIRASSTNAGNGIAESISLDATSAETLFLVVKRIAGVGSFSLTGGATTCGNGVVETGEQCDDGNVAPGDCCSTSCQYEAAGSACDDHDACTLGDVCNTGFCVGGLHTSCPAPDACHVGVCDPATGACSSGAVMDAPNGTPCGAGTCSGGVCQLPDAGVDAGPDAAPSDAGFDAGPTDAAVADASHPIQDATPDVVVPGDGSDTPPFNPVIIDDPGGCSCRTSGHDSAPSGLAWFGVAVVVLGARLRRRA